MPPPHPRPDAEADLTVRAVLGNPRLLTREALAGIVTTLALVPEVISFSVIAGVDPIVSLVSSVVLVITMSVLGGGPPWSPPPPGRWPWSWPRWSRSTGWTTCSRRWSWPVSFRSPSAPPVWPG